MLGLATASALASHAQASKNASAQAKAINSNHRMQVEDSTRQSQQQARAISAEMNDRNRQSLKDEALFDAVSGEFGGGKSVDRIGAVASIQDREDLSTIASNGQTAQSETAFQAAASRRRAVSQIGAIQRPSMLGTALTIGSAGLGAYTEHQRLASLKAAKP